MDIIIAASLSALATAVGSYVVQKHLERKRSYEALKRSATSVYIHIIPVLAVAKVLREWIDIFVDEDTRRKFDMYVHRPGVDEKYFWVSLTHEFIVRALKENSRQLTSEDIARGRKMIDAWGERKIFPSLGNDMVNLLPGHVMGSILRYEEFFIATKIVICNYFDHLIVGEVEKVDLDSTYQVWQHLELLYESATELSEALIKWCPLSLGEIQRAKIEYEKMAWIQLNRHFDLQEKMKPSTMAAIEALDKEGKLSE